MHSVQYLVQMCVFLCVGGKTVTVSKGSLRAQPSEIAQVGCQPLHPPMAAFHLSMAAFHLPMAAFHLPMAAFYPPTWHSPTDSPTDYVVWIGEPDYLLPYHGRSNSSSQSSNLPSAVSLENHRHVYSLLMQRQRCNIQLGGACLTDDLPELNRGAPHTRFCLRSK